MDGPQHFRISEELAELAGEQLRREGTDPAAVADVIALAQVHATLAAAAAAAGGAAAWREVFDPRPSRSHTPRGQ
jgi:hypothetical protein